MYLDSIEVEGYGPFKYNNKITIPDGLVGIIARHADNPKKSNFSGKSNFVNSVPFNFYCNGEFEKIEELVNDECDSMITRINFTDKGNKYITERGIKKGSSYFDMFVNDVRVGNDDKKGKTDKSYYQDKMNDLLGMTYDMFTASVFFEQLNMDKFINTQAEKRREYIDKVLNLEMWRVLYKNKIKDIKQLEADKKDFLDRIVVIKENSKTLNSKLAGKDIIERNIITLTEKRDNLQIFIRDYIQFKSTREQYRNLIAMSNHLEDSYKTQSARLEQLNIDIEKENLLAIDGDINKVLSEIEDIKKLIAHNKIIESELSTKIKDMNSNIDNINNNINRNRAEKLSNEKNINNILDGVCPTCKQEIDKELLERENEFIKNNVITLEKEIEKEMGILIILEIERKALHVDYNECLLEGVELSDKIKKKEFYIQKIEFNTKAKNEKLKSLNEQIKLVTIDFKNTETKLNVMNIEVERLKALLPADNSIFDNVDDQEKEIKTTESALNILNMDLGQAISHEQRIKENDKNIVDIENNIKDLEEKIYYYNILAEVYKTIPKDILKDSISSIEELANEIIQQIIPELSVKIYEDEEKKSSPLVIAFEENGKYRSYKRLSGGQKTIVNIGLRLGFSKIISERSKTNIECIILDEPFGALDEENREAVKKCLTSLLGYFRQVLVITHTDDINEFPNIITIYKDENNISWIR